MAGPRGRLVNYSDRTQAVELIKVALKSGASQKKACELLGISNRTYQRWQRPESKIDGRHNALRKVRNKLSDAERQQVIRLANSDEFANLPPCQIVPRLADKGLYIASESSFYRILREKNQLTHRQRSRSKSRRRPRELVAKRPNQVWSWDISYLATTVYGAFYYLYLVVDVFSRKIVGWGVHEKESSQYAALLIEESCHDEGISKKQLTLHSDNGAPMKGSTLLAKLRQLGVSTSFSRPAVSNDNPFSESLFKTLKYCHFYPEKPFDSINEARQWVLLFVKWYNTEHYHSTLKFITPEQRHQNISETVMKRRKSVYQQARQRHPERWSREIRNWDLPGEVILNPIRSSNRHENIQKKRFVKAA